MRKSFFDSLSSIAEKDRDVIFLTADLGFGFIEEFIKKNPNQFLNVGVSEQAMLGLANGLAIGGRKVICYSIAAFSLIRPFEFFRNGAIAHDASVMVVGVGPGFDYSQDGLSHYCLEDLAIMQSQPGVMIKTPFSPLGVRNAVEAFNTNPRPTYLRLPRNSDNSVIIDLLVTNPKSIDVLIICTPLMAKRANNLSEVIQQSGSTCIVGSLDEISLNADKNLINHLKVASTCLVVEDHYEFGGVGSRIGDLILRNGLNTKLIKDGVTQIPRGTIGNFEYMENKLMKSTEEIMSLLEEK
jgi:transketolase